MTRELWGSVLAVAIIVAPRVGLAEPTIAKSSEPATKTARNNTIYINPASLAVGIVSVDYERTLGKRISLQLELSGGKPLWQEDRGWLVAAGARPFLYLLGDLDGGGLYVSGFLRCGYMSDAFGFGPGAIASGGASAGLALTIDRVHLRLGLGFQMVSPLGKRSEGGEFMPFLPALDAAIGFRF